MDGLSHITDMFQGRIFHPNKLARICEEIKIMVLEIESGKEALPSR
jgi:ribosomal protein S1